jgi:hypothetical protein
MGHALRTNNGNQKDDRKQSIKTHNKKIAKQSQEEDKEPCILLKACCLPPLHPHQ